MIAVEFSKNANSAAIVEFLPFVVFCLATIGVCVFRALTSVGALFLFWEVKDLNYEEWFQRAAQAINFDIAPDESFLVRNLFQGQEWEALPLGDRKSFGRYFSSAIKDGRLKNVERCENAKGRQNQYIKK